MRDVGILHTEWSMGWGGQEIRIIQEITEFSQRGYRIHLVCRTGSRIEAEGRKLGVPVDCLPFRGAWDVETVIRLASTIRRYRVGIVHTHSSVDGWCGGMAARLAGVAVVRSRHLSSHVRPGMNARIVYGWLADRVISSGRHIREQLLAAGAGSPEHHVSVPAGADEVRFHPGVEGARVREEWGITPDAAVVGVVAVLRSWKGHEYFLRAARILHQEFPGMIFLLVGDGPMREQITHWIEEWGLASCTRLLGHRTDVPQVMKALSVCVLPSLKNEATSQVLPQAMLVGTPVICSSAGGLTEVVEDGKRGRVVDPGNAEALALAIRQVFAEPERTQAMAAEALKFAREELTFAQQINRTEAVYEELRHRNVRPA